MRIKINNNSMTVKEFIHVLERVLTDNQITKIDTPNIYFGYSKKVIEASLHKKEIDIETREQDGFDLIAF